MNFEQSVKEYLNKIIENLPKEYEIQEIIIPKTKDSIRLLVSRYKYEFKILSYNICVQSNCVVFNENTPHSAYAGLSVHKIKELYTAGDIGAIGVRKIMDRRISEEEIERHIRNCTYKGKSILCDEIEFDASRLGEIASKLADILSDREYNKEQIKLISGYIYLLSNLDKEITGRDMEVYLAENRGYAINLGGSLKDMSGKGYIIDTYGRAFDASRDDVFIEFISADFIRALAKYTLKDIKHFISSLGSANYSNSDIGIRTAMEVRKELLKMRKPTLLKTGLEITKVRISIDELLTKRCCMEDIFNGNTQ